MNPDAPPAFEAATVILVREPQGVPVSWECFMVRRHALSSFASDVFVFPGGRVDPEDTDDRLLPYVLEPEEYVAATRSVYVAAVRELFEEAGVLLARDAQGAFLRTLHAGAQHLLDDRRAVHAGRISLLELARREHLRFDLSALTPFAHWITPETLPKRFDTYFLVARLPDGQEATCDGAETTEGVWIHPAAALERYAAGTFPLVFATQKVLERMVRYPTVEALFSGIHPEDLLPVLPRIVGDGNESRILLPDDPDYAEG